MNVSRRDFINQVLATGVTGLSAASLLRSPLAADEPPRENAQGGQPVPGDRWMEIDLYWFEKADITGSVGAFWDRFQALYAGVRGYRGLMLNVGWTVGCVMDWSGDLRQEITLPTATGQRRWVEEKGPLAGTTQERLEEWKERFSHPVIGARHGYDAWTYADWRRLNAALRAEAARRGTSDFKVGLLNLAWNGAYEEKGAWCMRHPEVFSGLGVVDPGALLHADSGPHGGFPSGIPEGTPFHQAYAAQWGSLSKACGLDAIMLRDSFGAFVAYKRTGPWGAVAPSPEVIRRSTADTAALVRETKKANPKALVMMYSSGASAIGDWRCDGFDLESIAREGYLDIYVDQTWAGAWNEVGVREHNFWNNPALGWTYQLAYMLLHAAILAGTKVRHYPLVETFDAWEDWDVIHTVPQRLRWGIWAYSHAAVKMPQALKFPDGSYISWANQGKRLLSAEDVRFLARNLDAAIVNAGQTTEVFGPTAVYCRSAMQWQADHAMANHDIKEWIDEQVGSVIKWPVPVLSATRTEWLPQVKSDLFIVQSPSHLEPSEKAAVVTLIKQGQPMAIFGNPNGGIDSELADLGGLKLDASAIDRRGMARTAELADPAEAFATNVPPTFTTNDPIRNVATREATVVYSVDGAPMLTLNVTGGKRIAMWDPPELRYLGPFHLSLAQTWNGDGADYALAAGVLNDLLRREDVLHAEAIDLRQTMNISAWRTQDGAVQVMAGNMEEGLRDDADMTRHARLVLPASWPSQWRDAWSGQSWTARDDRISLDLSQAASVLLRSGSGSL